MFIEVSRHLCRLIAVVALAATGLVRNSVAEAEERNSRDLTIPIKVGISVCADKRYGNCGPGPVSKQVGIRWEPDVTTPQVVSGAQVRIGPLTVERSLLNFSGAPIRVEFKVTVDVYARSPALYNPAHVFTGADLSLRKIASFSKNYAVGEGLTAPLSPIYIDATLPHVTSAVKLHVTVTGVGANAADIYASSSYPPDCNDLPSIGTSDPGALDQACIQAVVSPLDVISPSVLPLAIIYVPPGRCSWGKLTNSRAVGTSASFQEDSETATRTISDINLIVTSIDKHQFDTESRSSKSSFLNFTIMNGNGIFSDRYAPESCIDDPDLGPGRGDVFVLVKNPCILHWNTANMTNSLYQTCSPEMSSRLGLREKVSYWSAARIEKGDDDLGLSREERDALLALDPLYTKGSGQGTVLLDPNRLHISLMNFDPVVLPIGRLIAISDSMTIDRVAGRDFTYGDKLVSASAIKESWSESTYSEETPTAPDLFTQIVQKGLALDIAWAASAGSLGSVLKLDLNFGPRKEIKTKTTLTSLKGIFRENDSATIQEIRIRDDRVDLKDVTPYYDPLFGTIAFAHLPRQVGSVRDQMLASLPLFGWEVPASQREERQIVLPRKLKARLSKMGIKTIREADPYAYFVHTGTVKGLPPGMRLNSRQWTLTSLGNPPPSKALLIGYDTRNRPRAQIWITFGR